MLSKICIVMAFYTNMFAILPLYDFIISNRMVCGSEGSLSWQCWQIADSRQGCPIGSKSEESR